MFLFVFVFRRESLLLNLNVVYIHNFTLPPSHKQLSLSLRSEQSFFALTTKTHSRMCIYECKYVCVMTYVASIALVSARLRSLRFHLGNFWIECTKQMQNQNSRRHIVKVIFVVQQVLLFGHWLIIIFQCIEC